MHDRRIRLHMDNDPPNAISIIKSYAMVAEIEALLGQTVSLLTIGKLTHLPRVPHICVRKLGQHWFR